MINADEKSVQIEFKINDEFITLSLPYEDINTLNIQNDDKHATEYIIALINNGFLSLKNPMEKIWRIDQAGRALLMYDNQDKCIENTEDINQDSGVLSTQNVKWNNECTIHLIDLVEKFDGEFQTTVKLLIWKKIAKIINETRNTSFAPTQVDTKWKGLKRTYHDVKRHNSISGNNIRTWIFFDKMHNFLFKKPEVNPPATCSSFKGLVLRDNFQTVVENAKENTVASEIPTVQGPTEGKEYASSFSKKRKILSTAEKRHKEKMLKVDTYLQLFERLVTAVEKK